MLRHVSCSLSLPQGSTNSKYLLCHGPGPCHGPCLGRGRLLARLPPRSSRWRSRRGPASCARACCPGASLQQTGNREAGGVLQGKTAPWIKPAALGALWMHKKVWVPPRGRGRRAGSQPERPPFSSPRLLEGCLCCSFCRLFREAVLSRGTSDFMSICKGTHLCLLPAKGQNLGVTQVQRADTSTPQTLSSTHTVWGAAGPFEPNLSLDIPQGLAVTKTVRGAPRGC